MKSLYLLAWFLLGSVAIRLALTGVFDSTALVALSLTALALVYGLALWSVFTINENVTVKNVTVKKVT